MSWMDIVTAALGAMEAKGKSDSTLRPKDQWYLNNPTSGNPFYNQTSSWNKGNPTLDRQMTPELAQVFDEVIWGALAQGREPYGMSDNMGRLQNLQENNQLGRYGQRGDPYTGKPNAGGRAAYAPVGSANSERSGEPNYGSEGQDQGSYIDEIQRAMTGGDGRSAIQPDFNPNSGGYMGRDGNWNAGDITGQFQDGYGNNMYNDVISYDNGGREMSWIADNADHLGEAFSLATGIPFGGIAGQEFQDWVYNNYTFMNPVDAQDPYGLDNYGYVNQNNEQLPHSGMNDGNTNPATAPNPNYRSAGTNYGGGNSSGRGQAYSRGGNVRVYDSGRIQGSRSQGGGGSSVFSPWYEAEPKADA